MTMQKVAEALEPFAKEADRYEPDEGDANDTAWDSHPTIGELRAARDALALLRSDAQGPPSLSDWEAGAEAMREACANNLDGHCFPKWANELRALPIPRRP